MGVCENISCELLLPMIRSLFYNARVVVYMLTFSYIHSTLMLCRLDCIAFFLHIFYGVFQYVDYECSGLTSSHVKILPSLFTLSEFKSFDGVEVCLIRTQVAVTVKALVHSHTT